MLFPRSRPFTMDAKSVILFIVITIIGLGAAQNKLNCADQETCGKCIQEPACSWCSKPNEMGGSQCRSKDDVQSNWCPVNKLTSPEVFYQVLQSDNINDGKNGDAVQIQPQKVKLRMRRGEEFSLRFQYSKAANYPIDLYYVMDLSKSMETHKDKLAILGSKLVTVMRNITTNFRLGFGSFVDKTEMPFTSTEPKRKIAPCKDCVPAYSFINHLSLSADYNLFAQQVKAAKVSGNLDFPEGGFDALMQAIVCKSQVGWREAARHMLVFSTDADSHVAGDGKLAGAVEPNDGQCHLENNEYTGALQFDYPSVGHLNYIAKENNVNLVFAIASNSRVFKWYQNLQQNFENSAVGKLDSDSSNVVDLVLENYNKIVDSVRMTDNSSSAVQIKYHATCNSRDEGVCTDIHVGEVIHFTAMIKPLECSSSNKHIIQIKPEGVGESLFLELEVDCTCECEKPGHPDFIHSSDQCSKKGDEICGACVCESGFFGSTCECDQDTATTTDDSHCRRNQNETEICSGLGSCKCGKCICEDRPGSQLIYGKYCECDNFSCKRVKGALCGGEDHGKCECGNCACLPGWKGEACDCLERNSTCISPTGDGSICSEHGQCVCGECQCNQDGYKYSGKYCEECASCPGQRCQELHPCVECQAYKTGKYNEQECISRCTEFNTTIVDKIIEGDEDENMKVCRVIDDDGCTIVFQYQYTSEKELIVEAQKEKTCPEPVNILVVVLSVIGSIVIGGLIALLVWKLYTYFHDKIEYEKFEKERQQTKWASGENPYYKGASTTFKNPTYRK